MPCDAPNAGQVAFLVVQDGDIVLTEDNNNNNMSCGGEQETGTDAKQPARFSASQQVPTSRLFLPTLTGTLPSLPDADLARWSPDS